MTSKLKYLSIEFKCRYFQLGELNKSTKQIWFVLHGQGHLAQYFIKQFEPLDNNSNLVIAPEGLNRYYIDGFTGRVGATWMTKEDRLTDIGNYIKFLNEVYNEIMRSAPTYIKINLLGFSQGVATVTRWALQKHINFHRLILWAGIFPYDMDFDFGKQKLKDVEIFSILGNKDPYVSDKIIMEQLDYEARLGLEVKKIRFEGEHELNAEVLKTFM